MVRGKVRLRPRVPPDPTATRHHPEYSWAPSLLPLGDFVYGSSHWQAPVLFAEIERASHMSTERL